MERGEQENPTQKTTKQSQILTSPFFLPILYIYIYIYILKKAKQDFSPHNAYLAQFV